MVKAAVRTLLFGVALPLVNPSVAQAQDRSDGSAPQTATAPQAGDDAQADIVVTATKRAESLQRVPIAVTAIGEAALKVQNIADTRDLVRLVPALAFVGGATTKLYNFTVRGVGTYVFSDGFDQSVGIAFDGVPLARPGGSIADLVDIERVEVLEGPQGMLFGKNASAGLVNIISRKPELGTRTLDARLAFGNFNELQTQATVNLPIGDTLAIRASAWKFRHDGYVEAPTLGRHIGEKNSYGGRVRALWNPISGTNVLLTGEWTGADQDPSVTTIRTFVTDALGVRTQEQANGTPVGPSNRVNFSPNQIYNRQNSQAYTLQIDQDVGDHAVTSVTSYRKIRVDESFDPESSNSTQYVSSQFDDVRYNQISQELRLTSPATQRLRYVIGGIYFRLDLDDLYRSNLVGATPTPTYIATTTDLKSEHYAAFAEFTFDLLDSVRLIAGGRASHDRVSGGLSRAFTRPQAVIPGLNGPGAGFGPFAFRSSITATEPSYRFGAQYDVAHDAMAYATVSRGYKGPGLDFQFSSSAAAAAQTGLRVRPEIADNYEIGLRSQLFNRKVTVNLTAFHERFRDFQASLRLPTSAPLFATQNANEIQSTGVEGTFDIRPGAGVSLSGSAAYIHARYADFDNAACYPREPTAPAGTPLTPGLCVGGVQSLDGVSLANSPRFSGNATARYDGHLDGGQDYFLQANYRYQSRVVFNSVNDPFERQGGYGVLNLAAGIRFADNAIGLSAYGKNVLGQNFVFRTVPQLTGAYYVQTVPYDARTTYGVALDFHF